MKRLGRENREGFTFIEVTAALLIFGIIACITIPNYVVFQNKAFLSCAELAVTDIKRAVAEYYNWTGKFPASEKNLGFDKSSLYVAKYIAGIRIEGGGIHVTLGNGVPDSFEGQIISFLPLVDRANTKHIKGWCDSFRGRNCLEKNSADKIEIVGIDRTTFHARP